MSWDRTPLVVREKILSNINHYPSHLLNCDVLANAIVKTFSYVLSERVQMGDYMGYPLMLLHWKYSKLEVEFPVNQALFIQHKQRLTKDLQLLFDVKFVDHHTTLTSAAKLTHPPFCFFQIQRDFANCQTEKGYTHYKIDWSNLTTKIIYIHRYTKTS
jgi:hypothetical protein